MLPDSLSKELKRIAKQYNVPDEASFLSFFERYYRNRRLKLIYPSVIKKKVNVDDESVYGILNALVRFGYLTSVYEFRCPIDGNQTFFRDVEYVNIPYEIICDDCEGKYIVKEHLYMVYEVSDVWGD